MVVWSPDDKFLLSSAVDNEVRQILASDGSLYRKYIFQNFQTIFT